MILEDLELLLLQLLAPDRVDDVLTKWAGKQLWPPKGSDTSRVHVTAGPDGKVPPGLEPRRSGPPAVGVAGVQGIAVTDPYLTTMQVAAMLHYRGRGGVHQLVKRGKLKPAGRRGRADLFLTSDVRAMLVADLPPPFAQPTQPTAHPRMPQSPRIRAMVDESGDELSPMEIVRKLFDERES